jgi:hypothetical protein
LRRFRYQRVNGISIALQIIGYGCDWAEVIAAENLRDTDQPARREALLA